MLCVHGCVEVRVLVALLVEPPDDALPERLRASGFAVVSTDDAASLPDDIRPDVLVLGSTLSPPQRASMRARFGRVPQIDDDGDIPRVHRDLVDLAARTLSPLQLSDAVVDLRARTVIRRGEALVLTERETALLAWLRSLDGTTGTRAQLLMYVWGFHPDNVTRTVDVTIARTRDKIEADAGHPEHLVTVRGKGYRLLLPHPDGLVARGRIRTELQSALVPGAQVTLVGPGGVGKTVLARSLVAERSTALWCDLVAVTPGGVAPALARLLRVPVSTASDNLGAALERGAIDLVVLDNAEHVQEETAALVAILAAQAPSVAILVTSRLPLHIDGEQPIELPPLGAEDATLLFRERSPIAQYGSAEPEVLQEIVELLDGLPLAIELAAARSRLISPTAMVQRLRDSVAWLRDRSAPAHHGSLLTAIRWSWELLDAAQQRTLAELSVFAGGADLPALEAVLSPVDDLLETIDALHEHGLLRIEEDRLQMWVGVAEFAREQLEESGTHEPTRARHQRYFADLSLRMDRAAYTDEGWPALATLKRERANLVAALDGPEDLGGDIVRGLFHDWEWDAAPANELSAAKRALTRSVSAPQRARLLQAIAWSHLHSGDLPGARQFEEALEDVTPQLEPTAQGWSWYYLSEFAFRRGNAQAGERFATRAWEVADEAVRARLVMSKADMIRFRGETERALEMYDERRPALSAMGDCPLLLSLDTRIATATREARRHERSLAVYRTVIERCETHDIPGTLAISKGAVGNNLVALGRAEEAMPHIEESLAYWTTVGMPLLECVSYAARCRALLQLERTREALDDALISVDLAKQSTPPQMQVSAMKTLTRCWLTLGEHAEARAVLVTARQLVEAYGLKGQINFLDTLEAEADALEKADTP